MSINSVSVILPNYNHGRFLKDRLDSIFNQTYQDFEVIILDDASTDASVSILTAYKDHPKVSHFIINKVNTGSPFQQWQKGLRLAKGRVIWIAESDDFCDLNFLKTQLKILDTSDVAVAKTMAFVEGVAKYEVKHPIFDLAKQIDPILYCPILNVSSVLFKAQILLESNRAHYTDYNIVGDRVFYFEYFRNARIIFNDETTNYFRQSNSNLSKLNNRKLEYYMDYFDEHSRFICFAKKLDSKISNGVSERYLNKFYNRISNRVSKNQKLSLIYLRLFLKFKCKLLFK